MYASSSIFLCGLECPAWTGRHPPTVWPSKERDGYVRFECRENGQCCDWPVVHYAVYEGGRLGEDSKATMDLINEWADRKLDRLTQLDNELIRLEFNRSLIRWGNKNRGVPGNQLLSDLLYDCIAGRVNPKYPTAASVAQRVAELEFLYNETEGRISKQLDILRQHDTLPSPEDELVTQAQQELGIDFPTEWPWITVRKELEEYAAAEAAREYDKSDSSRPTKRRRKNKR